MHMQCVLVKNRLTRVVCVNDPEDGLQGGAVAIQSLKQALVNVLQQEKLWEPLWFFKIMFSL